MITKGTLIAAIAAGLITTSAPVFSADASNASGTETPSKDKEKCKSKDGCKSKGGCPGKGGEKPKS